METSEFFRQQEHYAREMANKASRQKNEAAYAYWMNKATKFYQNYLETKEKERTTDV